MIYGTGEFRIKETNVGTFEIEKRTIAGWSIMAHNGKPLSFPTKEEASAVIQEIRKEWDARSNSR